MHCRFAILLLMLIAPFAMAQDDPADPVEPTIEDRIIAALPAVVTSSERNALQSLLTSTHWPFQVFGILRLDRHESDVAAPLLLILAESPHWQVRCFVLRQSVRANVTLPNSLFAQEEHPRVMRAALRYGIQVDEDRLERGARKLMRMRKIDELLLGLELAQASDVAALRSEAASRADRLVRNLDDLTALLVSRRLAVILGVDPAPKNSQEWRDWLTLQGTSVALAPPSFARTLAANEPDSEVSTLDSETIVRLREYLYGLRQADLDVVIAMDSTSSMVPMINQTRAEIDNLIVFLDDIARGMRMGFVAYRDHDNPPIWEGVPLTDDIERIRRFLMNVEITGGTTLPEAVFEGLAATLQVRWSEDAVKQVILVGDARPHDADGYKIAEVLDGLTRQDITVHAVHVTMDITPEMERRLNDMQLQGYREHNVRTAQAFSEIAIRGGGELATLGSSDRLVPAIMHFTLQKDWWSVFDEFYDRYLTLCR